jgi:Tfp pilus assembly protein PilV
MKSKLTESKRAAKGFSMLELMFAAGVLWVAAIGVLAMIVIGIGRNSSNRMDTTATNVAQTVMEDIASVPANVTPNPPMTITDCQGNNLPITTAVGGSPLTAGGNIDFSQPATPGYQVNYVMCSNNGQVTYDVRWRIDAVAGAGTWAKMVTVAVRQPLDQAKGPMLFIPPVTLSTVVTE